MPGQNVNSSQCTERTHSQLERRLHDVRKVNAETLTQMGGVREDLAGRGPHGRPGAVAMTRLSIDWDGDGAFAVITRPGPAG